MVGGRDGRHQARCSPFAKKLAVMKWIATLGGASWVLFIVFFSHAADGWDVSTLAKGVGSPYSVSIDAKHNRAATIRYACVYASGRRALRWPEHDALRHQRGPRSPARKRFLAGKRSRRIAALDARTLFIPSCTYEKARTHMHTHIQGRGGWGMHTHARSGSLLGPFTILVMDLNTPSEAGRTSNLVG